MFTRISIPRSLRVRLEYTVSNVHIISISVYQLSLLSADLVNKKMSQNIVSGTRQMGKIESLAYGVFQWIVGDINDILSSSCSEASSEVWSPEVPRTWMGKIELKLQCESDTLNLGVSASLEHHYDVRFPIRVSLVNCKSEEIHIFYISSSRRCHEIEEFVLKNMMDKPTIYDFTKPLTIKFEMYPLLANIFKIPRVLQPLDLQLESFLDNSDLSDIMLIAHGTSLHAHKVILSAASPFFANEFRGQTTETQRSVMNIDDMTADAVKEMLRFIYTGKIQNTEVHKKELLAASEKYDLPRLKFECVKYLCDTMKIDNAMEYLELAELYKSEELRNRAVKFFVDNGIKMRKQPRFDSLARSYPDVAQKLINTFFSPE